MRRGMRCFLTRATRQLADADEDSTYRNDGFAPSWLTICTAPPQVAIVVYEEAVQKLPTALMYDLYAAFLRERVDEVTELASAAGASGDSRKRAAALTLALLRLYSRAADAGVYQPRAQT